MKDVSEIGMSSASNLSLNTNSDTTYDPRLTIFVLDLDLTSIVESNSTYLIHPLHDISQFTVAVYLINDAGELFETRVHVINREELSELINTAYTKCGGMMILTAGCYQRTSMLKLLADCSGSSEIRKKQIMKAYFHSPVTDRSYFPDMTVENIQQLDKAIRLQAIIQNNPSLQGKKFVLFDDDLENVHACNQLQDVQVQAFRATTLFRGTGSKHCYRLVHRALKSFDDEYENSKENFAGSVAILPVKAMKPEMKPEIKTVPSDHVRIIKQSFTLRNGVFSLKPNHLKSAEDPNNVDDEEVLEGGGKRVKV